MPTIHDVAARAGVSLTTVSNVVNKRGRYTEETRLRVEQAISELGYVPNALARSLKRSISNSIGVLCEDINSSFTSQMVDGICDYADQHNYHITLANLGILRKTNISDILDFQTAVESDAFQNSLRSAIHLMTSVHVCGIIYISVHPRDITGILTHSDLADVPVVYLYGYTQHETDTCVNYDDFHGAKLAVDYLAGKGHKKIAIVGGTVNSVPTYKRMLGYQTSLMNHQIPLLTDYMTMGNWQYKDGYRLCEKLMQLPDPPTAIFAMSDLMAYGIFQYCYEHHICIPEDLSVIGYDDLNSSDWCYPPLTSIHVPLFNMGVYSINSLMQKVEASSTDVHYTKLFECSLHERASVASQS